MIAPLQIYLNAPLYKKQDHGLLNEVLNFDSTLDMHCIECKSESVFIRATPTPNLIMARTFGVRHEDPVLPRNLIMEYVCSLNAKHQAIFIFRDDGVSFSKIGEYPSRVDREYPEIKKYEKELGSTFNELKTGIQLYYHNIGIGSFIYLQWVVEKVIRDMATDAYSVQSNWSFDQWRKGKRLDDLIIELADKLPEFLVKNTVIYGILSKGVHELEEEECLTCFEIIKAAIEEILDDKIN